MMSKSQLIEIIAAEHDGMSKKDVKGVLESLDERGPQGTEEKRCLSTSRLCKIRRHQEAGDERTSGDQSLYERADHIQSETSAKNHPGTPR